MLADFDDDRYDREATAIKSMIGQTFVAVYDVDERMMVFQREDGDGFVQYHEQDCCEAVYIDDICGDVSDLIGSPILMAEAVRGTMRGEDDSGTEVSWTFYKFATNKGSVTFRWLEYNGDSGCYAADALVVPASKAEIEKYMKKLGH